MFNTWEIASLLLSIFSPICYADNVATVPPPLITPAPIPELHKRDIYTANWFIGYYSYPGASSYTYSTCDGFYYAERSVSGRYYGGCQSGSVLSVFTSCYGTTAYGYSIYISSSYTYSSSTTSTCAVSCLYDYLKYYPSATTWSYFVQCAGVRSPYTFYRTSSNALPAITAVTSTPTSFTTSSKSVTTTSSNPTYTSTSTLTPTPTPIPPPAAPNIAGPVAGGIFGGLAFIGLIGAAIFLFVTKRKRNNVPSAHDQSQPVYVPQPHDQTGYQAQGSGAAVPEKVAMVPMYSPVSSPQPQAPGPIINSGQEWNSPSSQSQAPQPIRTSTQDWNSPRTSVLPEYKAYNPGP